MAESKERPEPMTLRELRDFLNTVEEEFLDGTFWVQQENEIHYVHYAERDEEDMYFDPENPDEGCLRMDEWKGQTHLDDLDFALLKVGRPKGTPVFFEDF